MFSAKPSWRMLEVQEVFRAASRACANAGNRMLARIEMIAMTTSSSINVNALRCLTEPSGMRCVAHSVLRFLDTSTSLRLHV